MDKLQKLMDDVREWSDEEFGYHARNKGIIEHLKMEVDELIEAYSNEKNFSNEDIKMEFADCFMLLVDACNHFGMTADDIIEKTNEKLEINKNRKWGNLNKNGVSEHIKGDKNGKL